MLHPIGSGTLGPVFRSFDPGRDRVVVVKAFSLDLIPEDAERLAAVLRALVTRLPAHPHLVPMFDAGVEGATPYLAQACVTGDTLDVVMRRHTPATLVDAAPLLGAVASALDAVHAAGFVHGLLHPRDVLVDSSTGAALVTGAGVAAALHEAGVRLPMRRPYAAPEWTAGGAGIPADVFAFGALAHELLTGRRPVGPGEQDGAFADGCPAEARAAARRVLASALAADPAARPASAGACARALALAAGLAAESVPAPPPAVELRVSDDERSLDLFAREAAGPATGGEPPEPAAAAAFGDAMSAGVPEPPTADAMVAARDADAEWADSPVDRFVSALPDPPPPPTPRTFGFRHAAAVAAVLAAGALGITAYRAGWPAVGPTHEAPAPGAGSAQSAGRGADEVAETEVVVGSNSGEGAAAAPGAATPDAATSDAATVPSPAPPVAAPPPAVRVARAVGEIVVRSEPAGAIVTVDGRFAGESPVTVSDLDLGAHEVVVARPGFVPRSATVALSRTTPRRTVAVGLQPGVGDEAPLTGALFVDSRPRGARVVIDGRFLGTTPMRLPELSPGAHDVRVELAGYRPAAVPVDIRAGSERRLAVTLERGARPGPGARR